MGFNLHLIIRLSSPYLYLYLYIALILINFLILRPFVSRVFRFLFFSFPFLFFQSYDTILRSHVGPVTFAVGRGSASEVIRPAILTLLLYH